MDRIPSWCATCHQKTQLTMTSRLRCDLDLLLHTHNMSRCTLFQENEKPKTVNVSWCAVKAAGSGLALTALSIGWTGDDTMKTTVNGISNTTERKHACWSELLKNGDGRTRLLFTWSHGEVDEAAPLDLHDGDWLETDWTVNWPRKRPVQDSRQFTWTDATLCGRLVSGCIASF